MINNGRKGLLRIVVTKSSYRGLGIQLSVYSNIQYILVSICVLYSVQYNVQYSLEVRVRNNLHKAGWGMFFKKKCCAEIILCMASAFCGVQ